MNDAERPIYLDYNATTPMCGRALEAMWSYLESEHGNPSSAHVWGRRAREAVDLAREEVASLIGARTDEVVFTSGGTEASNLAIRGVAAKSKHRRIVTSVVEHPATVAPLAWLEAEGFEIARVGVDGFGRVLLDEAREAITAETALVTVMHANNETGTIEPIAGLAEMAHAVGALVHSDAAQSVGKVPVDVRELGVDLLTVAAHKLYGPTGVGALYVRKGVALEPLIRGAAHEGGLRPGTENVAGIVAFGAACALARQDLDQESRRVRALRDKLWERLRDEAGAVLHGHPTERLPNTLNLRLPGLSGSRVLALVPEIAASTGSACHAHGDETASEVIVAMGVSPQDALGAIRLSLGRGTTEAEIDEAASKLIAIARR